MKIINFWSHDLKFDFSMFKIQATYLYSYLRENMGSTKNDVYKEYKNQLKVMVMVLYVCYISTLNKTLNWIELNWLSKISSHQHYLSSKLVPNKLHIRFIQVLEKACTQHNLYQGPATYRITLLTVDCTSDRVSWFTVETHL